MPNETAYIATGRTSDAAVNLWPSQGSLTAARFQTLLMLDLVSSSTISWADIRPGDPDLEAVVSEMITKGGMPTTEDYSWADKALGLT